MKKILLFFIISIVACNILLAKDVDINRLLRDAQAQNKELMLFFHIPSCPYCERMLKENFKDKNLLSIVGKSFIFEDIYTKDKGIVTFKNFKGTKKEFAKHIGAFVYPATLFLNKNGEIIHQALGYRNLEEHLMDIQYISTKSYLTKDLETFILDFEIEQDEW